MKIKLFFITLVALILFSCSQTEIEPQYEIISYPVKLAENDGSYVCIQEKGSTPFIHVIVERKPSEELKSFYWSINGIKKEPDSHKEILSKVWDTDDLVPSCSDVFEASFVDKGEIVLSFYAEYRSGTIYTTTLNYNNNGDY